MATRLPFSSTQFFDAANNEAFEGAKQFTFETGTNTDKLTFTDAGEGTPHANPIIADANGIFPEIFGIDEYHIVITDNQDIQFLDVDPISGQTVETVAENVEYDNQVSGLSAVNVQEALDEIDAQVDINITNIAANTSALDDIESINTALVRGHIDGLITSNNSGSPNTQIDVGVGTCLDSTNTTLIELTGTVTTDLSLNINVGIGGRPSTVAFSADTWYHVFIVTKADGVDPLVVVDTDINAVNALADLTDYVLFRRVDSVLTDASVFLILFTITEMHSYVYKAWEVQIEILSVNANATTQTVNADAPIDIRSRVMISGIISGDYGFFTDFRLFIGDGDIAIASKVLISGSDGGAAGFGGMGEAMTDLFSDIKWRALTGSGAVTVTLFTDGYTDFRVN